ncbi:MAG: DinB family protein [Dermatophilaceae bacterium]
MSSTVTATDVLRDAYGRIRDTLSGLLHDLDEETLLWRPDRGANSIGWLAWHLTRVQDDHVAGVGRVHQVWTREGFHDRFGLPYEVEDIGYGQTSAEVGAFTVADVDLLVAYHDAVHAMTMRVLDELEAASDGQAREDDQSREDSGYARVIDASWDPPVTVAVRLVSVIGDALAHLGQIGYLRGLAQRR